MKITFLIHNVYGVGGTIRTTLNLATALAHDHDIEIVSMLRHRTRPRFAIDDRVALTPLVDIRDGAADVDDPRIAQPAQVFPASEKRYRQYSRLTDERAEAYLRRCDADVIIGTRPGVNVYLARFAPRRALRIGQEHLYHDAHSKRLRSELAREYRQLDAIVTTTQADATVWAKKMRLPGVRVKALPNSVPEPTVPAPDPDARVIAAAGRLVPSKRYDLLIGSFSDIAAKHPDWKLRLYGSGEDKKRLQALIEELGLSGRAELRGFTPSVEEEFAKASVVAVSSDSESFGMTLVEAMRCGVPVVSTNCPLGPSEIVHDEVDGRLVPVGDRRAFADALHELMGDAETRRRMGEAARASSRRYDPAPIARTYGEFFTELAATRKSRTRERRLALWKSRLRRFTRELGG
jgi:glycosyltransferase involved in cell wall biosynthesis